MDFLASNVEKAVLYLVIPICLCVLVLQIFFKFAKSTEELVNTMMWCVGLSFAVLFIAWALPYLNLIWAIILVASVPLGLCLWIGDKILKIGRKLGDKK